ncbi:MAG: acyclic terpene utilization AtuA family protein, partial [Candidatus Hydrogenedentota bacterium]
MKTIKIGCASGFWGDSNMSTPQLLASKELDYLVFDYLAEITMSIMARQRAKNPEYGYAHDFVSKVMRDALPEVAAQGVKVISNGGGVNPESCGRALEALIEELGLDLKVAVITGDELMGRVEDLRAEGVTEAFSGAAMPKEFMSMNAYLGAFPVAEALAKGADIVVTGRGVDSAVTLGACIHEFGWKTDDYDELAGGSLAGHIVECGAQATGGLFTDWDLADDWANIGYPIVEVSPDSSFVVSKAEGTGGIVCVGGVAEQMVYEIGDPQAYILPDVVCDFSQVEITQVGDNLVKVSGTKGLKPTDTLKVSATYFDGFRVICGVTIRGIDAEGKARKTV